MFWKKENKKNMRMFIHLVEKDSKQIKIIEYPLLLSQLQISKLKPVIEDFYEANNFHYLIITQEV